MGQTTVKPPKTYKTKYLTISFKYIQEDNPRLDMETCSITNFLSYIMPYIRKYNIENRLPNDARMDIVGIYCDPSDDDEIDDISISNEINTKCKKIVND